MNIKKYILIIISIFLVTSCYDNFDDDFGVTAISFASQKPLRTVIADTDMFIKVGVVFSGNRKVHVDDWAKFIIDSTLLEGTDFKLMPKDYYLLSDSEKMVVTNPNLPIAEVKITFTNKFYDDSLSVENYYAIPFKLKEYDQDSVVVDKAGVPKDYSIVVVKMASKYSGKYYLQGQITNLSTNQITTYNINDLNQNITCDLITLKRSVVHRIGYANNVVNPNVSEYYNLSILPDGSVSISNTSDTSFSNNVATLDTTGEQPVFNIMYQFIKDGIVYQVKEKLTRRQNPIDDLRFVEW